MLEIVVNSLIEVSLSNFSCQCILLTRNEKSTSVVFLLLWKRVFG